MLENLDLIVFNAIHGLAGWHWSSDWLAIFLAQYLGYGVILAALVLGFSLPTLKRKLTFFFFTILSLIVARGLLSELIRFFYFRPRPFFALQFSPLINHDPTASFPSGHAAFYFALAFATLAFNKRVGWGMVGAALLIGLGRVIVGIHWPSDILGGALIGFVGVLIVKSILAVKKPAFGETERGLDADLRRVEVD